MKKIQNGFRLSLIALIALFLPALLLSPAEAGPGPTVQKIKTAPDFSLANVNGGTVSLNKYKGKVVLVNYWATWCGPCVAELPDLNALRKDYSAQGFEIIGISMDDGADRVKLFMKGTPINYPVVMGNSEVAKSYGGINSLPRTFLIDRKGNIRFDYPKKIDKQQVSAQIKTLLAEK